MRQCDCGQSVVECFHSEEARAVLMFEEGRGWAALITRGPWPGQYCMTSLALGDEADMREHFADLIEMVCSEEEVAT